MLVSRNRTAKACAGPQPRNRGSNSLTATIGAVPILIAYLGSPAYAHTSERAFVLILPSDLYITGGAVVVALSFLLITLLPVANVRRIKAIGWRAGKLPEVLATVASLATFLVMIALLFVGHFGTQDPLANPLPLMVWTLWWIGLTVAHTLFGNLWSAMNPWRGITDFLAGVPGLTSRISRPPLPYPDWLGYWPAFAFFLAFAWFELIYTVPQNPGILASAVGLYFAANLMGALLFGRSQWLRTGEAFSVFFSIVSWLSPLNGRPKGAVRAENGPGSGRIVVTLPGLGLLHVRPLPMSGVAFVLLMLSAVSFDGLSKTYVWLAFIGVNPLDFPGRSAVALPNTLGLLAVFAALTGAYIAAVWLGHLLAGRPAGLAERIGGSVIAIVPIAVGYHFAHYLSAFLVDVQYATLALGDPLGRGWDLLGLADRHVTTSFLTNFDSVSRIWHVQIAIIVIAHVAAVAVAHLMALDQMQHRRTAILSQVPMTVLMVGYTLFGLWLLSSAAIG